MRNTTNSLPPFTIPALLGLVAGLLLGLLIGWVIWPVEWVGATLRDLDPGAKAEYVAAVADAYAVYGSAEAASQAQQRLAPLGSNLAAELDAAIVYFQEGQSPDKAIRDSNLRRLAGALGLASAVQPVGVSGAQSGESNVAPTPVVAGAEPAVVAPPAVGEANAQTAEASGSRSFAWLGWFLGLLTALLMIGGAIYIFMRSVLPALRKTGLTGSERATQTEEFAEDEYATNVQRRPTVHAAPGAFVDDADYEFADEEDEAQWRRPAPRSAAARPPAQAGAEEVGRSLAFTSRRQPAQVSSQDEADEFDEEFEDNLADSAVLEEDEGELEDGLEDDFDDGEAAGDPGAKKGLDATNRGADLSHVSTPPTFPGGASSSGSAKLPMDPSPTVNDTTEEAAQAAPRRRPSASSGSPIEQLSGARVRSQSLHAELSPPEAAKPDPPLSPSRSRQVRYKVLDQHTFQYHIGIPEYDESHPIVDSPSGKYIGEFGMGASTKNGLLQNDPNQLIALDVWLFDKSDERNLGNQTRVLLSEYAVDHNLDQVFLKERQDNPRPFTAQPGVHFQLESQTLLLDCTIVDVVYAPNGPAKGIFQSIKVDMAVQKK